MTIFSKIIAGEIPSYKIAENDQFYAFLDIFPLREGHTLVVPKIEVDKFFDVPDAYLGNLLLFAKPIARAIEKAFPCNRCGLAVIGSGSAARPYAFGAAGRSRRPGLYPGQDEAGAGAIEGGAGEDPARNLLIMIAGLGMDLIEVDRVAAKIGKEAGFRELVFSRHEIDYCESESG